MKRPLPWALLALMGLAIFAAADHAWWSWLHGEAVTQGDSARHAHFFVGRWVEAQDSLLGGWDPSVVWEPAYYPGLVAYLARVPLAIWEPSGELVRASMGAWTAVLVVGTGLLGRRLGGWSAGLAAAALVPIAPIMWHLRGEVMLDLPMAAMGALCLGLLPWGRPISGRGVVLAGGLLGLSLLSKQAMPYLLAPALLWAALGAIWAVRASMLGRALAICVVALGAVWLAALYLGGWPWTAVVAVWVATVACWVWSARAPSRDGGRRLGALAGLVGLGTLVAGPWYARSWGPIMEGLRQTAAAHADVPVGVDRWLRALGMLEYPLHGLLPHAAFWGLLLCLVCVPWLARRRAFVPTILALLGGFVGVSLFPDLHERHYAALLPLLAALAMAPLGLIRHARLRQALGGTVVLYGVVFLLSWRVDTVPTGPLRAQPSDHRFLPPTPVPLAQLPGRLLRWPAQPRLFALPPLPGGLPLAQTMSAIRSEHGDRAQGLLMSADRDIEVAALRLWISAYGLPGLRSVSAESGFVPTEALPPGSAVYVLAFLGEGVGKRGRAERPPSLPGFRLISALPGAMGPPRGAGQLQVWFRPPSAPASP